MLFLLCLDTSCQTRLQDLAGTNFFKATLGHHTLDMCQRTRCNIILIIVATTRLLTHLTLLMLTLNPSWSPLRTQRVERGILKMQQFKRQSFIWISVLDSP